MSNIVLNAKVRVTDSRIEDLPVLFVEGKGVLKSFCVYLKKRRMKSHSWKDKAAHSMKLLLDFAKANEGRYKNPRIMFEEFADCLYVGTIDENGEDKTELRWKARKIETANAIIQHITNYSEWLYDQTDEESELLNPKVAATPHERVCNLAAYHHKKNRAFLQHTWSKSKAAEVAKYVNNVQTRKPKKTSEPVKAANFKETVRLISEGFWRYGVNHSAPEQLNVREVLITMLLHFGGLRVSEPFNLYLEDIHSDPDYPELPLIQVNHPIEGDAPRSWRESHSSRKDDNRQTYLMTQYGIKDRLTSKQNNYHAGWKADMFKSFYVYWFPKNAGIIWGKLLRYYLATRKCDDKHPFLFTNQDGRPASLPYYKKAYARAMKKIGYTPKKNNGRTPHSGRHWYGSTLQELGVGELYIKKALHHSSVESQRVYHAEPRDKRVANAFLQLEQQDTTLPKTHTQSLRYGFEDVDPLGLFSGVDPLFGDRYAS